MLYFDLWNWNNEDLYILHFKVIMVTKAIDFHECIFHL